MDPATLEALNRASSLELFHLSRVIERLMSDPSRIVQIRLHLNLGKRVRFVDGKAPGAALQLRSGTVVAMKDTQVTVQDDATRATWTLPYAAIELPADSRAAPQVPTAKPAQRPTREDFRVGDRVSFEDRHLQTRIGTIVRINQKTAWTTSGTATSSTPSATRRPTRRGSSGCGGEIDCRWLMKKARDVY